MKKTFCDRCGDEVTGKVVLVRIEVVYLTNKNEPVGEDSYEPAELCGTCGDLHLRNLPNAKFQSHKLDSGEDAMMMHAEIRPALPPLEFG
jgi:hypothetical protein